MMRYLVTSILLTSPVVLLCRLRAVEELLTPGPLVLPRRRGTRFGTRTLIACRAICQLWAVWLLLVSIVPSLFDFELYIFTSTSFVKAVNFRMKKAAAKAQGEKAVNVNAWRVRERVRRFWSMNKNAIAQGIDTDTR